MAKVSVRDRCAIEGWFKGAGFDPVSNFNGLSGLPEIQAFSPYQLLSPLRLSYTSDDIKECCNRRGHDIADEMSFFKVGEAEYKISHRVDILCPDRV